MDTWSEDTAEGVGREGSESGRVDVPIRSLMSDRMQGWGACGPVMGSREDILCFLTPEVLRGEMRMYKEAMAGKISE